MPPNLATTEEEGGGGGVKCESHKLSTDVMLSVNSINVCFGRFIAVTKETGGFNG